MARDCRLGGVGRSISWRLKLLNNFRSLVIRLMLVGRRERRVDSHNFLSKSFIVVSFHVVVAGGVAHCLC